MRYATIKYPDIANGEGVRVSLFVQGIVRVASMNQRGILKVVVCSV